MPPPVAVTKGPLLEYLFTHFPKIKKTRMKQLLKYGSVTVNGRVATSHRTPLSPGDSIEFLSKRSAAEERLRSRLEFPVVFEDDSILVIDKPAGLLTMGTDRDKIHTAYHQLTAYVRAKSPDGRGRVFIVHRLDREASGLVVFVKKTAAKLALQQGWHQAVKKYFAVVEGIPPAESETLKSYLVEDKFRRVYSIQEPARGAKEAVTVYRTLQRSGSFALLDVTLVTGRKNQIRVHLSDLGYPIIGDLKYGSRFDPARRLGLHAYYLALKHPETGRTRIFQTPLPAAFARLF